jgi:alpha-beta hydrolase superfamily lysophospholipase
LFNKKIIDAAFQANKHQVPIAGVITMGGLLQVHPQYLPPTPVVKILCYLARYYPRLVMPATDFETTYDCAFGDKEWAYTTRHDPKIVVSPAPTIGMAAAILGTGDKIRRRAKEFPDDVPFMAIHGERDVRTSPKAMKRWVNEMKTTKEDVTIHMMDTDGHQLLQDRPEIIEKVTTLICNWIIDETQKLQQNRSMRLCFFNDSPNDQMPDQIPKSTQAKQAGYECTCDVMHT